MGLESLRGDGATGEGLELEEGPVGVKGQTEDMVVAGERERNRDTRQSGDVHRSRSSPVSSL